MCFSGYPIFFCVVLRQFTKKNIMKTIFFFIGIIFLWKMAACAGVDTLTVKSPSMKKDMPAAVVLPLSYNESNNSYPVIYLLHGAFGDFRDWLQKLPGDDVVQSLADQYQIIFVLPEGGTFSFYLDSPWDSGSQYETHIINELVPFVDKKYRTVNMPEGRAVTGLSMGGQGALYLAARNPGIFGAAGSMSGAVNLDIQSWDLPQEDINRLLQGFTNTLGAENIDIEFLNEHSATNLTHLMKKNQTPMIIDCGVDDFLIEANRLLNKKLLEKNVPHDYIERPGAHNWPYWQNALLYHALFFSEFFNLNN